MGNKRYENACSYPIRGMILKLCDANSIAHLFEKRKAFCANKKARRSIRRAACSVKNIRLLMRRGRAASPVIPSPARDLYGAIVSVSFRPSVSERRNLWQNSARVLYSLFDNTDCILPSRGGVKTRSKARAVLPCLQGVKRARRNRRHMGASPWQFVAESVSFFAADYFAAAMPPLHSGLHGREHFK